MTKELQTKIIDEILRLSTIIYEDEDINCDCPNHEQHKLDTIQLFAYCINKLAAVLCGAITINDFHDCIVNAPEQVRQFYIKLLFEEI